MNNLAMRDFVDHISHLAPSTIRDRKSTRLNSSHGYISYAVFCLKKKKATLPSHRLRASTMSPSCSSGISHTTRQSAPLRRLLLSGESTLHNVRSCIASFVVWTN